MQPAKVDPVECARRIVYAHASRACGEPGTASPSDQSATPVAELQRLAGVSAQPRFPPNIAMTLLCVLLSAAIVAWSIGTP
jgi:hypothetical protein